MRRGYPDKNSSRKMVGLDSLFSRNLFDLVEPYLKVETCLKVETYFI